MTDLRTMLHESAPRPAAPLDMAAVYRRTRSRRSRRLAGWLGLAGVALGLGVPGASILVSAGNGGRGQMPATMTLPQTGAATASGETTTTVGVSAAAPIGSPRPGATSAKETIINNPLSPGVVSSATETTLRPPLDPSAGSRDASDPQPPTTSEPAVYLDKSGDATGRVPNGAVNQPAFDLLRVEWAPVTYSDPNRRGYSTTITVAGTPSEDGFYVSWGTFYVNGEDCQLYNFLKPGSRAFANVFCGYGNSAQRGTRRFLGRVEGSRVTTTSTADGTALSATFDDPALPNELEASGRQLGGLAAYTSPCAVGCSYEEVLDEATSALTFRL